MAMTNITTVISYKAFEACLDGLLQINGTTAPSLKLNSQSQKSASKASADLGDAFKLIEIDGSSPG